MNSKQGKRNARKSAKGKGKRDVDLNIMGDLNKQKGSLNFKYISVPVAKGRQVRTIDPSLQGRGKSFVVKHREYLGDIAGSVDFDNNYVTINPGIDMTFPWGAGIARNYEQYRIRSLKFCYETQAATTEPGTVMMAIDYDPADSPPSDKQDFMSMAGAVRTPVWAGQSISADPSRRAFDKLFIRTGPLSPDLDIKTYDYGVLNFAVQGTNAIDLGELYVEYEIELFTPASSNETELSIYKFCANYLAGPSAGLPTDPFGTWTRGLDPSGGLTVTKVSNGRISIAQEGSYFLAIQGTEYAATGLVPDVTVVSGTGSVANLFSTNTSGSVVGSSYTMTLNVGQGGATFQFDFSDSCTSLGPDPYSYYFRPEQLTLGASPLPYTKRVGTL